MLTGVNAIDLSLLDGSVSTHEWRLSCWWGRERGVGWCL